MSQEQQLRFRYKLRSGRVHVRVFTCTSVLSTSSSKVGELTFDEEQWRTIKLRLGLAGDVLPEE